MRVPLSPYINAASYDAEFPSIDLADLDPTNGFVGLANAIDVQFNAKISPRFRISLQDAQDICTNPDFTLGMVSKRLCLFFVHQCLYANTYIFVYYRYKHSDNNQIKDLLAQ